MRLRWLLGLVAAMAASCIGLPSAAAAAEPLRIANLRVEGGEASWHAENRFRLEWDQVPGPPVYSRAVLYRTYDAEGDLIEGPIRVPGTPGALDPVEVPPVPGAYRIELWLEDAEGRAGPPAEATLRFDDASPPPPAPEAPGGWLAARQNAVLTIGHPPAPLPLSGIRGYAISLDGGNGSSPCASPSRCGLGEIDLPGGIADDEIALGALPEGTSFARVVAVSGSGVRSPVATAVFKVDTTTPLSSLSGLPPGGWSDGPLQLTASAVDQLSGMASAGPAGPFTAIAVDGSLPTVGRGGGASTVVAGDGLHQVAYFARDAAGNVNDGQLGSPPPATATVGIDEAPPQVRFVAAQDPAEPERIEAVVTDSLSGSSSGRGTIALREAGSQRRFAELPTRVVSSRLVAHWDSDSYPPGRYEFLATGFDRAGNAGSGSQRSNGSKMVLVNPLKQPVALEAGFGGRQLVWHRCSRRGGKRRCRRETISSFDARPAARSVPFGHGVLFGGRLKSSAGTPLGNQEVAVVETFAAGSEPRSRTTLTRTAPDGTFLVRLTPGPSRDVSAAFAGARTLTRATGRSVHLGVLAAVRLRASAAIARVGGAPIVFSGSVDRTGTAPSREGLPVELQFRYPGVGWSEFRTVETDAHGRFRYTYRFSDDDSRGIRFQFRAAVPAREGWPYDAGASRPVFVSGR
ncbi:MAG TPA: hypothetical protein VFP21_08120 [Solirubrobacterales bacterium]|nr:hypothetical protein [Solirubrobacterales bacterium]